MKRLLAALIANLRLGGIFISDTDLFQRDITKLLNSNIAPLYKHIKQLARIFPVYFTEIGAEGKLRDVTTAIDELSHRQDKLIHFLRKQTHTESNNTHVELVSEIMQFWHNGNLECLKELVPVDVLDSIDLNSEWYTSVHEIVRMLCQKEECEPEQLLELSIENLDSSLSQIFRDKERDIKRIKYLIEIYGLLKEKYSFEAGDIISILAKHHYFNEKELKQLRESLTENKIEAALKQLFHLMGKLKQVISNPEHSEGWENIYHKRHIAFGIPSMYGDYHEPKFEALGLTFRLEKIAAHQMEEMIQSINLDYITGNTLGRIYDVLELFKQGLELNGISNQGFNSNLQMFKYSLTSASFSLDQYINIFQFMAQNVREVIDEYFLRIYDAPLRIIIPQLDAAKQNLSESEVRQSIHKKSEEFLREILSSSFLIQTLDNFISNIINTLRSMVDSFSPELIHSMMTYDPDLIISPLHKETLGLDNQTFLGAKAFFLKKLLSLGFPVPDGFVLTTELFRHQELILKNPYINREIDKFLHEQISELERITGYKFGKPEDPLLLSVRAGTAISMPGAMNTFLNVGLNDEIVNALSRHSNFAWTSWDCYRRFLQSWGMAHGIERDVFDRVIIDFKARYQVEQKIQFSADKMRKIAIAYKKALHKHGVHFEDDPFLQLKQAIFTVIDSWSSDRAKVYREHLQIANEWGTAVIVQRMVLGNINDKSGTGVLFTHDPHKDKPGINLYGDFTLCSQGEDIVSGLVHALPVTEYHRKKLFPNIKISLESSFPRIYKKILDLAGQLVDKYGFSHQEIEFTFVSDRPENLHILQTRAQNIQKQNTRSVFASSQDQLQLIGRGLGIGGGALNGILAFDMDDLIKYSEKYPTDKHILVRPDTVPDDIGMIFKCDGLLTGRGGATSHAAVAAVRLGKVCIVGCKALQVNETEKTFFLNGNTFKSGNKIAIDGQLGNIYQGHYPTKSVEVN